MNTRIFALTLILFIFFIVFILLIFIMRRKRILAHFSWFLESDRLFLFFIWFSFYFLRLNVWLIKRRCWDRLSIRNNFDLKFWCCFHFLLLIRFRENYLSLNNWSCNFTTLLSELLNCLKDFGGIEKLSALVCQACLFKVCNERLKASGKCTSIILLLYHFSNSLKLIFTLGLISGLILATKQFRIFILNHLSILGKNELSGQDQLGLIFRYWVSALKVAASSQWDSFFTNLI